MPPSFPPARGRRAAAWLLSAALAVCATVPPEPPATPMPPAPETCACAPEDLTSVPSLQLLTSPPPPSSSAGAPEPDPAQAALHRAYRLDLVDLELKPPVFLNQNAASIIARDLNLGVAILVVSRRASHQGRPVLELGAQIDEQKQEPSNPYLLLCDGGHYSLLLPSEAPQERDGYYLFDEGVHKSYAEAVVDPGEGFGAPRRIPADGNCLITSLHFLRHGRFPDPAEIARLRGLVAGSLTGEQVADALSAMRSDLIHHAAETPFEDGAFPGYGPLTSSLLQDSHPEFMARRKQVLEVQYQQAAEAEIGRALQVSREQADWRAVAEAAAAARLAREREAKGLSPKERAKVAAYRSGLLEAMPSISLGPELAPELAAELGDMYVPIARVIPGVIEGRPVLRIIERINADDPDRDDSRCLLFQDGHCKVLQRLPEGGAPKDAMYYSLEEGPRGYLEMAFPGAGGSRQTTVPANGNSLLNGMFAMQEEEFPTPAELAKLKYGLNRRLTSSRVLSLLDKLRKDLMAKAAEQIYAGFLETEEEPEEGKAAPTAKRRHQQDEEEDPDLAQVPHVRPQLGLPVHGRPNVFNSGFSKVAI
jgi:hypothetical protein